MSKSSSIVAGRGYVELAIDDGPLQRGLNAAAARLKSFGGNMAAMGASIAAAGMSLVGPMTAAVFQFSDMGSAIKDASERTGVAIDALSELGHAAVQSGASLEVLETAFKGLSKLYDGAAGGSAEASAQLADLGLSVQDLAGLTQDQRFELLADKLSEIEDPARRAAAAMAVFGKSGMSLLPMIGGGAAGIRELREESRRLGLSMSGDDAEAAEALGD